MNFLITMSGGTTQVINATLVGCINGIRNFFPSSEIFIPKPGIMGVFNDNIYRVKQDATVEDLKKLCILPGSSITGTTRIKILDKVEIKKLESKLKDLNVSTYINIGGSGTIKQSLQLSSAFKDINFIALPKTIDNDLGDKEFNELVYTPGYLSVMKYVINHTYNLIRENEGACSNDKVLISQLFGRDTGHISAISTLVKDNRLLVLFPEKPQSWTKIKNKIEEKIKEFGGCIVIVPEGYPLDENFKKEYDLSGQVMWGSSHNSIAQIISNKLNESGIQSRISNTTIEQRQSSCLIDKNDVFRSYEIGFDAIQYYKEGKVNFFNSLQFKNNSFFTKAIDLNNIKDFNRNFPLDWITDDGFGTTSEYSKYIKKLKPGETLRGTRYMKPSNIIEKYE